MSPFKRNGIEIVEIFCSFSPEKKKIETFNSSPTLITALLRGILIFGHFSIYAKMFFAVIINGRHERKNMSSRARIFLIIGKINIGTELDRNRRKTSVKKIMISSYCRWSHKNQIWIFSSVISILFTYFMYRTGKSRFKGMTLVP